MRWGLLLLVLTLLTGLWRWDRPDRNPFQVARVYRLLTWGCVGLLVAVVSKTWAYRDELRWMIQFCR